MGTFLEREGEVAIPQTSGISWRRRLRANLPLILLGEVCLLLYLAPRDLVLSRRLHGLWQGNPAQRQQQQLQELMENDLPLGSQAPRFSVQPSHGKPEMNVGDPLPTGVRAAVVVFIGACTDCVKADLQQWETVQKRRPDLRVVVVSQDTPEGIQGFLKATPLKLPILADTHRSLARAYHAVWLPRAYLIDRQGKLRAQQTHFGGDPRMVLPRLEAQGGVENEQKASSSGVHPD